MDQQQNNPAFQGALRRTLGAAAGAVIGLAAAGCAAAATGGFVPWGAGPVVALGAAAEPAASGGLTDQQARDVEWLSTILANPANDRPTRTGAAERLLAMDLPHALEPLKGALLSGEPHNMLPVLEAMRATRDVSPALMTAAIESLPAAPPEVRDALAAALAPYGDDALERISDLAADEQVGIEQRLGPIHVLGAFRSRAAAVHLMSLLEDLDPEQGEESGQLLRAVCDALRRGTGLPYGADPEQWRRWWAEARDQPQEAWLSSMVRRLSEQQALAERQVQRERAAARETERRLVERYRELFPSLSIEDQLKMLPSLLDDPLASMRRFALDRIARLLRDSVSIPEALQQRVAERLADESADLRLEASHLLDQLNLDGAAARIAQRLPEETDREVIAAHLEVLIRRPTPEALDVLPALILEAHHGERAARALWTTLSAHEADPEQRAVIRAAARAALERALNDEFSTDGDEPEGGAGRRSAARAHARLVACLAEGDDLIAIERLLDSDDVEMRRHVAQGLLGQDIRQPLLDRRTDEALAPFVIDAIVRTSAGLSSLRMLAGLAVPEGLHGTWREALATIVAALPAERLLEADEVLRLEAARAEPASAAASRHHVVSHLRSVRTQTLERASDADSLPRGDRLEAAARLARIHLDRGRPEEAMEIAAGFGNGEMPLAAREVKFEAAALTGRFDVAAGAMPEPEPWVTLLESLSRTDPQGALALHGEILQRFDGKLTAHLRATLEAIGQRLSRPPSERPDDESPA